MTTITIPTAFVPNDPKSLFYWESPFHIIGYKPTGEIYYINRDDDAMLVMQVTPCGLVLQNIIVATEDASKFGFTLRSGSEMYGKIKSEMAIHAPFQGTMMWCEVNGILAHSTIIDDTVKLPQEKFGQFMLELKKKIETGDIDGVWSYDDDLAKCFEMVRAKLLKTQGQDRDTLISSLYTLLGEKKE